MTTISNDLEIATRLSYRKPLTMLRQKIEPGHTALIIVDVQNDFCAEGGMMSKEGLDLTAVHAMAARLPPLLASARSAGALVVFVRNVYSTLPDQATDHNRPANMYLSDTWLEQAARTRNGSYTRRAVCAQNSWEGDFFGAVHPLPGEPIITKHRYSAFHNTDLDTVLRARAIRTLVLAGVATNVCVETTAREGFVRDYYIVFLSDGTATYSQTDQDATLRNIDRYFGEVASVAEVANSWTTQTSAL